MSETFSLKFSWPKISNLKKDFHKYIFYEEEEELLLADWPQPNPNNCPKQKNWQREFWFSGLHLDSETSIKNVSMQCNVDWDLENPFRFFSNAECASPLSLTVVFRNEEGKKKNSSHLHVVHELCHEMEQDNQRASLICPARIDMLVRVSHNHGLNRKTWWECSSLEGDDGLSIGCGALWKQHHMRPFVVNCSSSDIACCMVSWFCRDSVHRNNLKPKKKGLVVSAADVR